MADSTSGASGSLVAPFTQSQVPDYLDAQRKQMLAGLLLQNSQRSLQTPEGWDNMRVVPRKSILSSLTGLGSAYLGGQANQQAQQATAKYNTGLFNPPAAPPPQQPSSMQVDPNGASTQALQGYPSVSPGIGVNSPEGNGATPAGPQFNGGMVPPGGDPQVAARAWAGFNNPQLYMDKYYLPIANGTPEFRNAMIAAKGNRGVAQQLMLMKLQSEGMMKLRPGETVGAPNASGGVDTKYIAAQNGIGYNVDDGNPQAYSIPNYAQAAGAVKGAEKANEVANTPGVYPQRGGGSTVSYPGDVPSIGLPPSMRGSQAQAFTSQPNQRPAMGLPPQPGIAPLKSEVPTQTAPPPQAAPAEPKPFFPQNNKQAQDEDPYWKGAVPYSSDTGIGGQTTRSLKTDEYVVSVDGKNFDKYGESSTEAAQKSRNNMAMLDHLANATTGTGHESINEARSLLAQIGFASKDQLDKLSDSEITEKYLSRNGTEGLRERYGRLTQGEVTLAVNKQAPSMNMQHRSILALTVGDELENAYNQKKAEDYSVYSSKHYDPRQFETWYSNHHNINDFVKTHVDDTTARVLGRYNAGGGNVPMTQLPPAGDFPGKRIQGPTGILRSDGKSWNPEK